ncbi:tRNA (adenosine(37)-N6)-threonylcarbamoyltransferase complex ATPase subunit type 1 TsaE, partial [Treponema endosymbiont of Eucomonympha sp.]|uniref:tRNA (adenosine(37)-N6)-threonylcarbamoyltransferase complex ATPase subunit type 1 TsaE n=1 Tax=Treponema endosymbiont of Eucomonympha sp. TaxID=1580831 RepID=UPI0016501477
MTAFFCLRRPAAFPRNPDKTAALCYIPFMLQFATHTAEETVRLGEKIGSFLRRGDVVALSGALAAGKTTFAKGVARALGVAETLTSPTFTIISEYAGRMPLYHMDMYRLGSEADFINLGAADLLYAEGLCVGEWSAKLPSALP